MLQLSLTVRLESYVLPDPLRPVGPRFHRWLPNGRADAIKVATADTRNELYLWFDRLGYVSDGGMIYFDWKRREVDEELMKRQHHLDAGPLRGDVRFCHVTEAELNALRDERCDATEYMAVGKRVIKFVYPPVHSFVELLRNQYGQYWLPSIKEWDSRKKSLGSYCVNAFGLHWRESDDDKWRRFTPGGLHGILRVPSLPGRGNAEYLTEADWRHLQRAFRPDDRVPLALAVIAKAHELEEWGHAHEALVQAVTGVELALAHFLSSREVDKQFYREMPLKARLGLVGLCAGVISRDTLDKAAEAIETRNEIVHEGQTKRDVNHELLLPLFECVKALLSLHELKTPVLYMGNGQTPPEYGGRQAFR